MVAVVRGAAHSAFANPFHVVQHTPDASRAVVDGRTFVTYSSNDYLGMLGEPSVRAAAKRAIDEVGTSAFASRVVSGERAVHRDLERALAGFLGVDDAVAFVSANSANVSVIATLLGPRDVVVYDERSHDSVLRGIDLAHATGVPFRHNDPNDAERVLRTHRAKHRRALVFVEGLYSMDGDVPDLAAFAALRERYQALLMVDECLSLGVLGATGRGIGEHAGIERTSVDIWMGGISKALASCGGYVAGNRDLVDLLRYSAPGYVYTTAMTPPNAAAALAALNVLESDPGRPARVRAKAERFRALLRDRGADTGTSAGVLVVPVILPDALTCLTVHDRLLGDGVRVQPVLHPAVPENSPRLRFFVTAAHGDADLVRTADLVGRALDSGGIARDRMAGS